MDAESPRAVVLLSGGLDSATTLAIARDRGYACYCLSVDYGQRHRVELKAAARLAVALGARAHQVIALDLSAIGGSALTDPTMAIPEQPSPGIPVTYVPARNTVFLALALGWAEVLNASDLFIGVNAVDFSGYPDCRPEFIAAFEHTANVATKAGVEGRPFRLHAPLIDMKKEEILSQGMALKVDYGLTISCYQPNDAGQACGRCDSCRLRLAGFAALGLRDPAAYVGGFR